jgi:3-hydroxyisobutyrate dehydrogenase-like beta-hydroxyacid dehydrogenase
MSQKKLSDKPKITYGGVKMKVGFIGVGKMGGGMAKNALKQGFNVFVYDIDKEQICSLSQNGAKVCNSLVEIGKEVDIAITMLPVSPFNSALEEVILDEKNGLIQNMSTDTIIMDGGNTSPKTTKYLARRCKAQNINFFDIPLSGGPEGAEKGILSVMVGGDEKLLPEVEPLLRSFGKTITYFGEVGSGQLAKLCNNMIVAMNLAALSEALVFAAVNELDIGKVYEALRGGAAGSWAMENYGKYIIERTQPKLGEYSLKGGRDRQLNWALNIAAEKDIPLPVTSITHEMYKIARTAGKMGKHEPIVELLEDLTNTFVSKNKNLKER